MPAFSRRDWLKGAGVLTASAYPHLGLSSEKTLPDLIPGKSALRLLNDRPLNAETPAHLLDETTTSTTNLFVRNNGNPPVNVSATDWRVSVSGESCVEPQSFSVLDLKNTFKSYSYDLQLECGGNGRAEFRPRASGNQWTTGAVGCPRWTGVRVADVLNFCGIAPDAEYLGFKAADTHLSGDPAKSVISRG
ncbi:MAG: DMSO/TMAO reductase YedYZ molybdopterin-dependent catalytic subunit, partial [Limisphaerales bacterium]